MTRQRGRLALRLAEPGLDGHLREIDRAVCEGLERIVLHADPRSATASAGHLAMDELTSAISARWPNLPCSTVTSASKRPDTLSPESLHVLLAADDSLPALLLSLLDLPSGTVIAPRGRRAGLDQPLFVVSIPKAGTHLLLQLVRALGFSDGGAHEGDVAPGSWFYVEYSNAHTAADDFLIDSVRRSPFGNRGHPALSAPILFAYRYPPDILLSEAHYYHRPGNSPLAGYLADLPLEDRLLRLAEDPFLFGRFRDRMARFVPWLSFPNVVPVSFEELVGRASGGCDEARRRLLWSLLLKLQVAGEVDSVIDRLSGRAGETFREGRVGRSQVELPSAVRSVLAAQPQDVMSAFGYPPLDASAGGPAEGSLLSARREEFLRRALEVAPAAANDQPVLIETDYLGFNIIQFRGRYFAHSMAAGPLDLAAMDDEELGRLISHSRLGRLRRRLLGAMLLEDEDFLGRLRAKLCSG